MSDIRYKRRLTRPAHELSRENERILSHWPVVHDEEQPDPNAPSLRAWLTMMSFMFAMMSFCALAWVLQG